MTTVGSKRTRESQRPQSLELWFRALLIEGVTARLMSGRFRARVPCLGERTVYR